MEWLLAVYNKQVPLSEAALDVAVGFALVLGMLILLIAIFWLFGKVMTQVNKTSKPQPVKEAAPSRAAAPVASAMPVAEEGISDEVVAVIAAAIAAMAPEGTTYAVRRISRQRAERPVWAAAGVVENTRPF